MAFEKSLFIGKKPKVFEPFGVIPLNAFESVNVGQFVETRQNSSNQELVECMFCKQKQKVQCL